MARLGIVDVIPEHGRMIPVDEFPHLCVRVLAVSLALRFYLLIVSGLADGAGDERPIVATGIVETHLHALFSHGGTQLADDIAGRVLAICGQRGVRRCAGPERESIMMFRGEHHVFRARITKQFGPRVRIPLLDLSVENGRKIVVIVCRAIVLAMIGLCRRSLESHTVSDATQRRDCE